MHVFTLVGTRPQYIKAAPLSRMLRQRSHRQYLFDTGQHYDPKLSKNISKELGLPLADYVIPPCETSPIEQLAAMLPAIERALHSQPFDWIITFGDTRSTLAAILSAIHTDIPIVHIEAGLRATNTYLPEEYNRRIADHCADILFCPTETAVKNLQQEGIHKHVYLVGDLMYEQFLHTIKYENDALVQYQLSPGQYCICTIHRAEILNSPTHLKKTLSSLTCFEKPILFPLHPHTKRKLEQFELSYLLEHPLFHVVEPLPYSTLIGLIDKAYLVLTDSGGVQKEAAFAGTPCIVLRKQSEWIECIESGIAALLNQQYDQLLEIAESLTNKQLSPLAFGDGCTAEKIVTLLESVTITKRNQ